MNVKDLIKRIQEEKKKNLSEIYNSAGLMRLQEIASTYDGEYRLIWSDDLLKEIKERPRKNLYKTGLELFDEKIGGFREQQLVTISASTKHGKTTYGIFLMGCLKELNPVMIPLEQSNEEIVEQRYENGYTIPRFLSPKTLASRVTTDWIEERIVEGIAKHNTKLVLIDHLGYIDDYGTDSKYKRENLAYRIGQIMKSLKIIAKRWNVVIILLTHIHQHDEGKPPSLEDIKNSSDIIQESDLVLMLWRKNSKRDKVRIYEDKTLLSIQANRRTGKNGNIGLVFDSKNGTFTEDQTWVSEMEEIAKREVDF